MQQLKPMEILEVTIQSGVTKGQTGTKRLVLLGLIAGLFIALAGVGANMGGYYFLANPETVGLGRLVSGIIFPAGLVMVVLAGAELFTGNNMMIAAVLDKRITAASMLRNWIIVYIANLVSSMVVAWLFVYSGLMGSGNGMLESVTISIAATKASLPFGQALVRGIFCNFLVCLAVWMANGASTAIGKVSCIFFPILLFVTAGFEHSVANMFFIPAGIFADGGATAGLTFSGFFIHNLIPVTLGNILGGSALMTGLYYFAYKEKDKA